MGARIALHRSLPREAAVTLYCIFPSRTILTGPAIHCALAGIDHAFFAQGTADRVNEQTSEDEFEDEGKPSLTDSDPLGLKSRTPSRQVSSSQVSKSEAKVSH